MNSECVQRSIILFIFLLISSSTIIRRQYTIAAMWKCVYESQALTMIASNGSLTLSTHWNTETTPRVCLDGLRLYLYITICAIYPANLNGIEAFLFALHMLICASSWSRLVVLTHYSTKCMRRLCFSQIFMYYTWKLERKLMRVWWGWSGRVLYVVWHWTRMCDYINILKHSFSFMLSLNPLYHLSIVDRHY